MKKNVKKLRLNRDTLALLDAKGAAARAGNVGAAIVTSCTYDCDCHPGCSAEEACLDTIQAR